MSFNEYILREQYRKVKGLGDRLELMKQQINWKPFVPLVQSVFHDDKETGGRPHTDELIVVRAMLLQAWYGLTDPELEFQCHDRLSFRNFLDFPEKIPDFTTIWKIRERLKDSGVDEQIWKELQRQLKQQGYTVKKGVIQDAAFIETDLGRKRNYEEKKAAKEGKKITYTEKQKSHIDRDSSFSVKHGQVHHGYKTHTKSDVGHSLIREFDVTTASVHDSQIGMIKSGDRIAYRDKAYFGTRLPPKVKDQTMKRGTRKRKLNAGELKRNKLISKIRAPGERPFAVVKRLFNGARTFVKRIERVKIKEMFKCFAFDLYQLVTLKRKQLAKAV